MTSDPIVTPEEVAGELVADQQEAAGHHDRIRRERVPHEAAARAPVGQRDQDRRQRQPLADLDADVEAHDVGDEPVLRQRELLQLGRQAEAVEQAEDEHRRPRVRLEAEEAPEAVHVLERLVDHREADDRVDEIRVGVNAAEHAAEQREAVARA